MIHESNITISSIRGELAATLTEPSNRQKPCGAVLLLHGWVSNRNELGKIYTHLAQLLAEHGIVSLRFDFFGCGESSPERVRDLTISGMISDAIVALHYLQKKLPVDGVPLGLCGFSLGAAVMALLLNGCQPTNKYFSSVVGLSPMVNLVEDFGYRHQKLIDIMRAKSSEDNQPLEYDLGWKKILVRPQFVREFSTLDEVLTASWKAYTGACMVIGGELDFSGENVKKFSQLAPNCSRLQKKYLPQVDHFFNVLNDTDAQARQIVKWVSQWFMETLCP